MGIGPWPAASTTNALSSMPVLISSWSIAAVRSTSRSIAPHCCRFGAANAHLARPAVQMIGVVDRAIVRGLRRRQRAVR